MSLVSYGNLHKVPEYRERCAPSSRRFPVATERSRSLHQHLSLSLSLSLSHA
jgi:hypothetical protein